MSAEKITTDIEKCPLCGAKHALAKYRPYKVPLRISGGILVTHFYPCDTTNQPLLLTETDASGILESQKNLQDEAVKKAIESVKESFDKAYKQAQDEAEQERAKLLEEASKKSAELEEAQFEIALLKERLAEPVKSIDPAQATSEKGPVNTL